MNKLLLIIPSISYHSIMIDRANDFLTKTASDIERRDIAILRDIIQYHRAQYYADAPVISDEEFDRLYALLVAAEERFQMQHDSESPTLEVARLADNHFTKAKHRHQMMSLDNTYNAEDLREFENRIMRILNKEDRKDSDADEKSPN